MKRSYLAIVILSTALLLSACSGKKAEVGNTNTTGGIVATPSTSIDPSELSDTSKWKTVSSDSRFFKFSIKVPPSARYYFSPDTVMGTENGVFIGEDRFPYGMTIEYNALNDRDARTVTFKSDYLKSQPSDIDFGLPGAVRAEGTNTRGLKYTRYLVRKDPNLYIISITTTNPTYAAAYQNMIKTLKIEQ